MQHVWPLCGPKYGFQLSLQKVDVFLRDEVRTLLKLSALETELEHSSRGPARHWGLESIRGRLTEDHGPMNHAMKTPCHRGALRGYAPDSSGDADVGEDAKPSWRAVFLEIFTQDLHHWFHF